MAAISARTLYAATGCHNHPTIQVSHVHFVSFPSCHPVLRRQVRCVHAPVACASMAGFTKSERLPTCTCVTTLNRVRFMLRPEGRLIPRGPWSPGFMGRNRFRACRSGFGANRQLPRQVPCNLLETSLSGRLLLSLVFTSYTCWRSQSVRHRPTVNKAPRGAPDIPHTLYPESEYNIS